MPQGTSESAPTQVALLEETRPPSGDFAFATHAKLHRTIVTPWAGGYAANKEVWGTTSRASAADVVLPSDAIDRQDVPPNGAYRMAFIADAPGAASIPLEALQRLDTMRRFWEVAFSSAMLGRRAAETTL